MATAAATPPTPYSGPIVDPHIHLLPLDELTFSWLRGPKQVPSHEFLHEKLDLVRHPYLLNNLREDSKAHHVVKFVHVQAESDDAVTETQYVTRVAAENVDVGAIVSFADLHDPNVEERLALWSTFPLVRGVRQLLNWHETRPELCLPKQNYPIDPQWQRGYALLEKYNLHFEFHGFPTQLYDALVLAQRFPNVRMVVNHAGLNIDFSEEGMKLWRNVTSELGKLPNVYMKLSGICMIKHDWTIDALRMIIRHLIDSFGVDRCMFASNFPMDKAIVSYATLFDAFKQTVIDLPETDQRKLFYDNAARLYRL